MIKENLKDTGFRWPVNHRTPVRLSSTMYKNNSRESSKFRDCSPLQLSCNLTGKCHAVGYYSYTDSYAQLIKFEP